MRDVLTAVVMGSVFVLWTVSAASGQVLTLSGQQAAYEIDGKTGALHQAAIDGEVFIEPSLDAYALLLREGKIETDESQDQVTDTQQTDDGQLKLACRNEKLKLTIIKTYHVEPETGWLFKQLDVSADEGAGGLLVVESGVSVPQAWWRKGYIWHPIWHTFVEPFRATESITEMINWAPNNGTRSLLMLYQPQREQMLVHFRWGGKEFQFFDFTEIIPVGSKNSAELEVSSVL